MTFLNVFVKVHRNQFLPNILKSINERPFCTKVPQKIRKKLGFIGDGNMAKAMCKAFVTKGLLDASDVHVSSPYINNLKVWKDFGANITLDNTEVAVNTDIVILSVKPHLLNSVLSKLIEDSKQRPIKDKLFISILAGIKLQELEEKLGSFKGSRVIRVMPNTPMQFGAGCSVYCPGQNATKEDLAVVKSLLEVTGVCELIPEKILNASAAISSSGPAFAFLFIEALSDGGVRMGLHREMATKFAAQTVLGAAKMVLESNKHMGVLKDEVCSAGGMTIAGIHALEKGSVRGDVLNAVEAATIRADELAK